MQTILSKKQNAISNAKINLKKEIDGKTRQKRIDKLTKKYKQQKTNIKNIKLNSLKLKLKLKHLTLPIKFMVLKQGIFHQVHIL